MKLNQAQFFNPIKALVPQGQRTSAPAFCSSHCDTFERSNLRIQDIKPGSYPLCGYEKFVGLTSLKDEASKETTPVAIVKKGQSYFMCELDRRGFMKEDLGYIKLIENSDCFGKPSVFISSMGVMKPNSEKKGVGTLLHQIAIERSVMLGCEGRVKLNTEYNSEGFHYGRGYRYYSANKAQADKVNELIKTEVELAKTENRAPDFSKSSGITMYLPDDAIAKWGEKIKENPVLLVGH